MLSHPVRVLRLLAALAVLPAALEAQEGCGQREPAPGPLVSAEWLRRHLADTGLVLLNAARGRAPFDSAHIAGARFVALADYTVRKGDVEVELPTLDHLESLLEGLGVGGRGRIVLYGETLAVSRLFFTLDYLGLGERVSVLDGGLPAWRAAGGPLTAEATPAAPRSTLSLTPQPTLVVDAAWVNARRQDPAILLLDNRNREEFEGTRTEAGVARPGHIPGAVNLDWTATLSENGKFLETGALRQLLAGAGAAPGREIVTYCRTGTRSAVVYFVGRLLGYPVRLYDGSMNEWAGKPELPVASGPAPRP